MAGTTCIQRGRQVRVSVSLRTSCLQPESFLSPFRSPATEMVGPHQLSPYLRYWCRNRQHIKETLLVAHEKVPCFIPLWVGFQFLGLEQASVSPAANLVVGADFQRALLARDAAVHRWHHGPPGGHS